MIPILYGYGTTDYDNNGVGRLSDAFSCKAREELNGIYELTISYPLNGRYYNDIHVGCVIKAKANDTDKPQLFDICTIERNLTTITIKARHVSYRLNGYPCRSIGGSWGNTVQAMFDLIPTRALCPVPFTFVAEYNPSTGNYASTHLRSVRSILLNNENSLLTFARGEYHFDNFKVTFKKNRGEDKGVTIRYGKNLLSLNATEESDQVYTHIIGVYDRDDGRAEGNLIPTGYTFPYQRVKIVDCSEAFQSRPSDRSAIDNVVWQYVGDIGDVLRNIKASVVPGSEFDGLNLGDTVTVAHPLINIGYKKKVVAVEFDGINERYTDIDIGTKEQTLDATLEKMRRALA